MDFNNKNYWLIFLLIITSLVIVNFLVFEKIYVGDYVYGDLLIYPPPYKFVTRTSIYNVSSDKTITYTYYGFPFGFSITIDKYCAISISSYGFDWYVLLSSILIITYYLIMNKKLYIIDKKKYFIITILLSIIISLLYTYVFIIKIPVSKAYVIEYEKPISCTTAYNQIVCLVDVIKNKSVVHLVITGQADLYIMMGNELIDHVRVNDEITYNKLFYNGEYRLVLVTSMDKNYSITYRRIYVVNLRDPLLSVYLILASLIILVLIPMFIFSFKTYLHISHGNDTKI